MEYWLLVWELVKLHTQIGWEIFKLTWFIPAAIVGLYFTAIAVSRFIHKKKWKKWLHKHEIQG